MVWITLVNIFLYVILSLYLVNYAHIDHPRMLHVLSLCTLASRLSEVLSLEKAKDLPLKHP